MYKILTALLAFFVFLVLGDDALASGGHGAALDFPPDLGSYNDAHLKDDLLGLLSHRASEQPFNVLATLVFLFAIIHTFLSSKFLALAHKFEHEHEHEIEAGRASKNSVSMRAGIFHFLGEVEAVFGLWVMPLAVGILYFYDWDTFIFYTATKVNYTEALFVVVIMALAATRPIVKLTELLMWKIARLFGGMLPAWWLTIMTVGPILGSFITEPAAMTISALLLASKFYDLEPSNKFKYATIGLLFVNVSVGGTLSHFAAPPVLMVSGPWDWGFTHMLLNFGWKAVLGIGVANAIYYYYFRKELDDLQKKYAVVRLKREMQRVYVKRKDLENEFDQLEKNLGESLGFADRFSTRCEEIKADLKSRVMANVPAETDSSLVEEAFEQRFEEIKLQSMRKTLPGLLSVDDRAEYIDPEWDDREDFVPYWVMLVHVVFMGWTVLNAHYPALFAVGGLFFLGFAQVTHHYQNRINLKPPLLVGFFLGALVVHGGVQGWWIAPVLGSLAEAPLMIGATVLTAFNDNAAITYLSTLIPNLADELKYAVVAGAVTGGGLTVIANAPNPAGQSLLKQYFENGVSPFGLFKSALVPTVIMGLSFFLLRGVGTGPAVSEDVGHGDSHGEHGHDEDGHGHE
jgi:hypothetical protein